MRGFIHAAIARTKVAEVVTLQTNSIRLNNNFLTTLKEFPQALSDVPALFFGHRCFLVFFQLNCSIFVTDMAFKVRLFGVSVHDIGSSDESRKSCIAQRDLPSTGKRKPVYCKVLQVG